MVVNDVQRRVLVALLDKPQSVAQLGVRESVLKRMRSLVYVRSYTKEVWYLTDDGRRLAVYYASRVQLDLFKSTPSS